MNDPMTPKISFILHRLAPVSESAIHPGSVPKSDPPPIAHGANTTTVTHRGWLGTQSGAKHAATAHALVIAWSLGEPQRVGELALLGDSSPEQILGRGGPTSDDDAPRLSFVRHRPGAAALQQPLAAGGISRRQLRLV